jgi:hypothetical protein
MKTVEASAITEPIAGRRRYVQGIPAEDSAVRSLLPVRDSALQLRREAPTQTFQHRSRVDDVNGETLPLFVRPQKYFFDHR